MTVLVGKNNEGKSNILRALTLAMDIMKLYAMNPRMLSTSRVYLQGRYNWERDYPVSLQEVNPNGLSSVDLTFELSEHEINDIRQITGIRLSSYIPVRVSINHSTVKIDIPKRGTAAFSNPNNKQKIIEYVCNKIDFNFIPAVRTEQDALKVIESLIETELKVLDLSLIHISKVRTILEEADIKPNKITYYCENRDPDFDQKMHNVLLVYKQLSLQFDKKGQLLPFCEDDQVVHVLSYDEKPGIQAIATTSEDIQPDNNHKTISRDYEYRLSLIHI